MDKVIILQFYLHAKFIVPGYAISLLTILLMTKITFPIGLISILFCILKELSVFFFFFESYTQ